MNNLELIPEMLLHGPMNVQEFSEFLLAAAVPWTEAA
jgi:hypothetical protein